MLTSRESPEERNDSHAAISLLTVRLRARFFRLVEHGSWLLRYLRCSPVACQLFAEIALVKIENRGDLVAAFPVFKAAQ